MNFHISWGVLPMGTCGDKCPWGMTICHLGVENHSHTPLLSLVSRTGSSHAAPALTRCPCKAKWDLSEAKGPTAGEEEPEKGEARNTTARRSSTMWGGRLLAGPQPKPERDGAQGNPDGVAMNQARGITPPPHRAQGKK
uniref:Uncharacterized protein n=1 Tax=Sphaerodactylus townsendi TaxID=933632 RepID=A0ACB8FF15_9SAUR